jgi:hypothetical protein
MSDADVLRFFAPILLVLTVMVLSVTFKPRQ